MTKFDFEISVRYSSATQASLVVADFGSRFSGIDRAVLNVEPTARPGAAAVFGSIDDRSIAPFAVIDAPLSFTGRMVGPLRYADREALAVTSVGEGVGDALQPLSAVAKKDIGGFHRSGAGAGIFDTISAGGCYGGCIVTAAFCALGCGDDGVCHLMCAVSAGKCLSECGKKP